MKNPCLKFKFEAKLDAEIAWHFYNQSEYAGLDFWQKGAIKYHDSLNNLANISHKKLFLSNYVANLYKQHESEFKQRQLEISALCKNQEETFFLEINKIFKHHPWPSGKYFAYLSIFDFCPRFLDDKTFFLFMYSDDQEILFTIFHEMLHFIFYDYCFKKYPQIFKNQDTETGSFWEIAELFNAVIQQTPNLKKLLNPGEEIGYPKLKPKFKEAKKSWQKDVDAWIDQFAIKHI